MAVERTPRTIGAVWGLLVLNTLGSAGAETIVPLPPAASGKVDCNRSVTCAVGVPGIVISPLAGPPKHT